MRTQLTLFLLLSLTLSTAASAQSKGPIDVYLIGGQSNATGQGYLKNLPEGVTPDPRVLLFHSGGHLHSGAEPNRWIPLRQASESPDRFGPELGFGNRIVQLRPDRKTAIIKHAYSGTNLFRDWAPGSGPDDREHWGRQFATFVATVDAGLAGLRAQGYEPVIRGMLWQQGESDTRGEAANQYAANLTKFIARVREQFHAPDMLFVYGYVLPPPNRGEGRDKVRRAQRDVDHDSGSKLAVRGAHVVETDDLSQRADDPNTPYPNDRVHFGTAGTYELGRRMAEKMSAALEAAAQGDESARPGTK